MGWVKKARNAGPVNANYKTRDGNAQLSVIGCQFRLSESRRQAIR
jgi:hypothetical protein